MLTAAADLCGIPFAKLKRFAYVINFKFFEKTTFYRIRSRTSVKDTVIKVQEFVCCYH